MNTEIPVSVNRLCRIYAILLCVALPALALKFIYTTIFIFYFDEGIEPVMNFFTIFIYIPIFLVFFLAVMNLVLIILNFMKMKRIDSLREFKPIAIVNVIFSIALLLVGIFLWMFLGFWDPLMSAGMFILCIIALTGIIANASLISFYSKKEMKEVK